MSEPVCHGGMEFLHPHFPDGQLRELTVHADEEAVHLHSAVAVCAEKIRENRGAQHLLRPSANPMLANYEYPTPAGRGIHRSHCVRMSALLRRSQNTDTGKRRISSGGVNAGGTDAGAIARLRGIGPQKFRDWAALM